MSEEVTESTVVSTPETSSVATDSKAIDSVRKEERLRVSREEKLRQELDETKKKLSDHETRTENLRKSGWDLEVLANTENTMRTNDPNKQIQSLSDELRELQNRLQKQDAQSMRVSQLNEINLYVNRNVEEFELIKLHNAHDDVLNLIENYYRDNKRMLTYKEAATAVEKDLERIVEENGKVYKDSKKARKYFYGDQPSTNIKTKETTAKPDVKTEPTKTPGTVGIKFVPDDKSPGYRHGQKSPGIANYTTPDDYLQQAWQKHANKRGT